MSEKKNHSFGYSKLRKVNGKTGTNLSVVYIFVMIFLISGCTKNVSYDPQIGDPLKAGIANVIPSNLAGSVFVDPVVTVTFVEGTNPALVSSATITLKKGNSSVPGTIGFSQTAASFSASTDLESECEYVATVKTKPQKETDFGMMNEYSWKFKTGKHHRIDSLSVVSVTPQNKATAVLVSFPVTVTFNQELSTSMKSSVTFLLKKSATTVTGVSTIDGKTLSFQPASSLEAGSLYTGSITIRSGSATDDKSARNFIWSFTTDGAASDVTAPTISSVLPANNAVSVLTGAKATATFSEPMNPATITASTFTLKQGTTSVPGTVSYTGTTATFTPAAPLTGNLVYTGTITTGAKDIAGNALAAQYVWSFKTATVIDVTAPTVLSVVPANASTGASTTTKASVTFSEPMKSTTLSTTTFSLKQGSTVVAGSVIYSGTTATFTPSAALLPSMVYTGTVTTGVTDAAGNALAANYTWSFTTAAIADITPPTIISVVPLSNAASVAVNTKATATFSEGMDATTITSSTFTLKQGSSSVAGSVSFSGTLATFTPSVALTGSTLYTATITTGAKDLSGNALASNYIWSFTTAAPSDVTPPTVLSVTPANNATSVALNSNATAVFSEPMNTSLISTSTFTVKQGSTAVAGSVTYSGTTATFAPSAALTGNTVYTCTITTGVKDMAGNAMVSNYSWSFTTVATVTGKSFATDVMPILNLCNTCHTHNWSPSSTASTFYTNLLNSGYVNTTTPTSGKIYTKLNGGHPSGSTVSAAQKAVVLTWITEGSKNN
jgi:hypothetical protein